MIITRNVFAVSTSHGKLVVEDTGGEGLPILLLHGNLSNRNVFARQLESDLLKQRRIITVDLPGHGESENAIDPYRTYTRPGLADVVSEMLSRIGVREFVAFGWSLGGHIAIELLSRCPGMRGLVLSGTPPVGRGAMSDGFIHPPLLGLAGKESFCSADVDRLAHAIFGSPVEPFISEAIVRADHRFRKRLFAAAKEGDGVDQKLAIETTDIPLAIINGADDPLIKLDYLDTLDYVNLWDGKCHRMDDAGHAAFWHKTPEFNRMLSRFLDEYCI